MSAMNNGEVSRALSEIADLLEIEDASVFRVRAYRFASQVVADLPREASAMLAAGEDLTELPGIGKDLASKIRDLALTGDCEFLRELRARIKPSLTALMRVPGLGPKRVRAIWNALHLETVEEVASAARAQQIRTIKGFGAKTEEQILRSIETRLAEIKRVRLDVADVAARELCAYLSELPGVARVIAAGSLRRAKDTIGDLDLLVTAAEGTPVMERFAAWRGIGTVLAKGTTRATAILQGGLQVDLRLVPDVSYGAALHYFTGSKEHNVAIRMLGVSAGLKINEYGVFRGEERICGDTEESVFASIGLAFVPPELRENRGEIAAAREGRLPKLISLGDLRGDLRVQTSAGRGKNTLREMADAARARGLEYFAVCDFGVTAAAFEEQVAEIERLRGELEIFAGIEVAIAPDGTLEAPPELLDRARVVVAGLQTALDLDAAAQTARVLKALDHPRLTMLAHPTARIVGERDPVALDLQAIAVRAKERGVWLELCGDPSRLDLSDAQLRLVKEVGAPIAVSSAAAGVSALGDLQYGVAQARRAWLEAADVINTRPAARVFDR